jgi:hypothetical protein
MEFMRSEILPLNLPVTTVFGSFTSQQTGLHIAGLIYGLDPESKTQCVDELIRLSLFPYYPLNVLCPCILNLFPCFGSGPSSPLNVTTAAGQSNARDERNF